MKYVYILLALLCCASAPEIAFAKDALMRVTADAEVRIKPDRAAITFGLFEKTENLRQGVEKLNTANKQVIHYLRTRGIEERYIQTNNLQILPVYDDHSPYSANTPRKAKETLQYEISQTFTVTLEDPTQYEDVLYTLLELGINRIENISFFSTQVRQYRDQARQQAIQSARQKARLMAEAAGVKLGKIVDITEDNAPVFTASRWSSNSVQNITFQEDSADGSAPATGMISIRAAVQLTYQIK